MGIIGLIMSTFTIIKSNLYVSTKYKILIVEDDAVIAQLIEHHLLDFGYHVLDIVHDSEKALDKIYSLRPDLVLLDINILGTKDGIEVAHVIEEKYNLPYIFLTAYSDPSTLERAQNLSPMGYVVKPFKERDLLATITIGMSNYQKFHAESQVTKDDINKITKSPLSEKEFAIVKMITKGYSNNQIASELEVSVHTIKWHSQNIYSKLGVKNRTSVAQLIMSI